MDPATAVALAAVMGAQRIGAGLIGAKQGRTELKNKIRDLRARRLLLGVRRQEVGENRDISKQKLMSKRGIYGPSTEGQRVDTVTARAMQRLALEEASINRAIDAAKRARRLAKYGAYTGWVPEVAATGLAINELGPSASGGSGTNGLEQAMW